MRVVLAVDKFKGSATADEVAGALAEGWLAQDPDAELVAVPVADGGDGTVAAVVAHGWTAVPATVTGPWGDPTEAVWARSPDRATGLVELATASGIALSDQPGRPDDGPRRALTATTTGTGELLRAALEAGCRTVVLGAGGSATTDGGAGMLQALGARLLDEAGAEVAPGLPGLEKVTHVDLAPARRLLGEAEVVLAADVDNPLCGPRGAAAVYGPQKGADPATVARADAALARWAEVLGRAGTPHLEDRPGAGAAGGVGFAAMAALDARRVSGVGLVLDLVGLDEALEGADLVVTGEGRLDAQTLEGKAPAGVLEAARRHGLPVVAVCGTNDLGRAEALEAGFAAVRTLQEEESDPDRCMADPLPVLRRVGARLAAAPPGQDVRREGTDASRTSATATPPDPTTGRSPR